jgi:predicted MFS family arabinose efflux permease
MGPKLLFIFGIVLAHGALAAGWMAREAPRHRAAVVTSCTQLPTRPLHIAPQRELLAYVVTPTRAAHEVLHP